MEDISIKDVKSGDLIWECEQGRDALLLAVTDARRQDRGIAVDTVEVLTGKPVQLFNGNPSYGPRLYRYPQYTKPDLMVYTQTLVRLLESTYNEGLERAAIREQGLQQAATEYSESRDMWYGKCKEALIEVERLHAIISEVRAIVARPANGIDMQRRVETYLDRELGNE